MRQLIRFAIAALPLSWASSATAATHEVTTAAQLTALLGVHGTASTGDRIHIQKGEPYVAPAGGWKITKPLEIYGDGPGAPFIAGDPSKQRSTWLQPHPAGGPVLVIDIGAHSSKYFPNLFIHDLSIGRDGGRSSSPGNYGIQFTGPVPHKGLVNPHFARVNVFFMGDDGFHFTGTNTGEGSIERLSLDDCSAEYNWGDGVEVVSAIGPRIQGGRYRENAKCGILLRDCNDPQAFNVLLEGNQRLAKAASDAQMCLEGPVGFSVIGCHFENFAAPSANATTNGVRRTAIAVTAARGGYIGSNDIVTSQAYVSGSRGVYIWYGFNRGIVVGPNHWAGLDKIVEIQDVNTITSCVVMPQAVDVTRGVPYRVVVPEAVDRGHLIMASTGNSNLTAGIQSPRLSAARRDSMQAPANGGNRREGLVLYNDDAKRLNYWNGAAWSTLYPDVYFPKSSAANSSAGGLQVPVITTTERDRLTSPTRGMLIFNSSTGRFEGFDGSTWKAMTP